MHSQCYLHFVKYFLALLDDQDFYIFVTINRSVGQGQDVMLEVGYVTIISNVGQGQDGLLEVSSSGYTCTLQGLNYKGLRGAKKRF